MSKDAGRTEMALLDVEVNSFHRFSLDRLSVTPELLGATHRFTYEDKDIVLSIPKADKDSVPFDQRRVHCWKWKAEGNVPLEYSVYSIDLEIELKKPLRIPEAVMQRPPNQFELIGDEEQKRLNSTVSDAAELAKKGFEYWLSVIRWKSGIGHIGEPQVRYASDQGGGAVLRERATGHRVWLQPRIVLVIGNKPVSLAQWEATQKALSAGKAPPIWFGFLFDSEQRANNSDITGSILSLAIALEVNVRRVFSHGLEHTEPVVLEVLDQANLRSLLNRIKKHSYWNDDWKDATNLSAFNELMTCRDRIMHSAQTDDIDVKELRKMQAAVKRFAYFTCDFLGLS
ncbi:MAG: hypothetical protein ABSA90_01915 [Xanthobacteraceae bacterium]|jgi:hypothetical protein